MAFISNNDTGSSSFLIDQFEGIGQQFTDLQELSAQGYSLLLRAKRYGRFYVLKTLSEDTVRQSAYTQILRKEFEVLMLMQHPGVVQAMGLEQVEGVGPCIVMEYIDGDTLTQLLAKDTMMPLAQRRRIADELCDALAYVHSLGIVHRDLKPDNIMVTHNGLRVKLIDFGMADTDQHAVLKQPAGTLDYMAPEQAQQAVPDVRNDIYSLGLILQELHLGGIYNKVTERCLRPIGQRYANMSELQEDVRRRRTRWSRLRMAAAVAIIAVLLSAVGLQAWRLQSASADRLLFQQDIDSVTRLLAQQQAQSDQHYANNKEEQQRMERQMAASISTLNDSIRTLTRDNDELKRELNRLDNVKRQALAALHAEMRRSCVSQHLDTLSRWNYRWHDLSRRIADVSRFIYRYTDELRTPLNQHERDQVRQAMLDDWQTWSRVVSTRANAVRMKQSGAPPDTFIVTKNTVPKDKL